MCKSAQRRRRDRLFREDPRCRRCGVVTVHPSAVAAGQDSPANRLKNPPPNMATLEHRRSRLHSDRQEPNHSGTPRTTLFCLQCNSLANQRCQRETPVEELRRRASHSP